LNFVFRSETIMASVTSRRYFLSLSALTTGALGLTRDAHGNPADQVRR
jgi:hypothetical protein